MQPLPVSVVLVGTTHSGNIGATARIMANMGLANLKLVNPEAVIDEEARARASGADHVHDAARSYSSIAEAVADAVYVVGTTARRRESAWRVHDPAAAASLLSEAARGGEAAVVFGRESSGLSNSELDACDALVSIPVDPQFPSLNLAAAVTVIAYELRRRAIAPQATAACGSGELPATVGEREFLFSHLGEVLHRLEFVKGAGSEKLLRKIRHLYMKAQPTSEEVAIIRGVLSAIEFKLKK